MTVCSWKIFKVIWGCDACMCSFSLTINCALLTIDWIARNIQETIWRLKCVSHCMYLLYYMHIKPSDQFCLFSQVWLPHPLWIPQWACLHRQRHQFYQAQIQLVIPQLAQTMLPLLILQVRTHSLLPIQNIS